MTNKVDDIREIIHVGDLFTDDDVPSSMEDGIPAGVYYQVFGVTKNSVLVAQVYVPDNYDFSKKELLEPYTDVIEKKVFQGTFIGTFCTYICIGLYYYFLAK